MTSGKGMPLEQLQKQHHRNLIVGGHNIERGRYPYFVSINKNNGVIVSGALIAPDIVLSAGHVSLNNMDNLTIKVGTYAVHDDETTTSMTAEEEIPQTQWLIPNTWGAITKAPDFFHNDFMILKLARKSATHRPVKINRDLAVPLDGERVIMTGLGWTNASVVSPATIVQEVELVAVDNHRCASIADPSREMSFVGIVDDTMLCTAAPPNTVRDGCAWDSGGPVIIAGSTPEEDLLVGLGSSGYGCADPIFPAIQANVASGADWIREQVCRLSVDPPEDFHCNNTNTNAAIAAAAAATTTTATAASMWMTHSSLDGAFATNVDDAAATPLVLLAAIACLLSLLTAAIVVVGKHRAAKVRKQPILPPPAADFPPLGGQATTTHCQVTYGTIDC